MSSKSSVGSANKRKVQMQELQYMFQQLQMAVRLMQMTLGKLSETTVKLDLDVSNAMGVLNDLQYRTLAMMQVGGFDKVLLDQTADELKCKDFDFASGQEDEKKNFMPIDVVTSECDVILTSFCKDDESKSMFRSRIALGDITDPKLREKFVGLKVGDVAAMTLRGVEHAVEILGIRTAAPKPEVSIPEGNPSPSPLEPVA